MADAITVLKADHVRLRDLFSRIEQTTERGVKIRKDLLAEIEQELQIHTRVEEEVFYPAVLEAAASRDDRLLFFRATEEHHSADLVLVELKITDPREEQFAAKARLLGEMVDTHVRHEEREMFVRVREMMEAEQLQRLMEEIDARRKTLLAQWNNPIVRPLKRIQTAVAGLAPAKVKNAKATAVRAMRAATR